MLMITGLRLAISFLVETVLWKYYYSLFT